MTTNDFLRQGLSTLKIPANDHTIDILLTYFRELLKWSQRINLIGKATDKEILESHFLDSLTVLPYLDPCPSPGLVDVGSGAGFPGLPLKILRPDIKVTLVEPRNKRASFLRHIIRTLKLNDIMVFEQRIEGKSPELTALHGNTPLLISRAVTAISPFLRLCKPFCYDGSRVICMKGPKLAQELAEWQESSIENSDFALASHHTVNLPFSGISRNITIHSYHGV